MPSDEANLKRFYPGHSFLAEEPEFSENNRSDFLWIIDPLDGTTFHNRGLPFFSSILALEVCGQTELGLVSSPFTGDVFVAGLGRGCTFWNRRLRKRRQVRVSGVTNLADVLVGYSYGKSELHARHMATTLSTLFPMCRAIVRLGGAEIGYVASGACDAFIDNNSTPWDFAAVALMVREAGGRVTDFAGREWTKKSDSILASNGRAAPQAPQPTATSCVRCRLKGHGISLDVVLNSGFLGTDVVELLGVLESVFSCPVLRQPSTRIP